MSKLEDEDGIDGPWERAIARVPRPRCACGRARRKAAAKCQRCLDADHEAARFAEPPRRFAREWRRLGYLCAIFDGSVYVVERIGAELGREVRTLEIDAGRWSRIVELEKWKLVEWGPTTPVRKRLVAIARDCYCSMFPDTGCDFCNGTRRPDGRQTVTR